MCYEATRWRIERSELTFCQHYICRRSQFNNHQRNSHVHPGQQNRFGERVGIGFTDVLCLVLVRKSSVKAWHKVSPSSLSVAGYPIGTCLQ